MTFPDIDRAALDGADLPPYPGVARAAVSLVVDAASAATARAALAAADAIGFDTESKPTFRKGEVSTGPHLVQLATDAHVWLFPTACAEGLTLLRELLAADRPCKVGFGLGNDRSALSARFGIELGTLVDLGEILRGPGHRGTVGARMAVAHFFGQRLQKSKKIGTSNWAVPRLDERQILYAANDAHVALSIYRRYCRDNPAACTVAPRAPGPATGQGDPA